MELSMVPKETVEAGVVQETIVEETVAEMVMAEVGSGTIQAIKSPIREKTNKALASFSIFLNISFCSNKFFKIKTKFDLFIIFLFFKYCLIISQAVVKRAVDNFYGLTVQSKVTVS